MNVFFTAFEKFQKIYRDYIQKNLLSVFKFRQRIVIREEFYNLGLAVVIGIIGGICNLIYHLLEELLKGGFTKHIGEISEIAEHLPYWQRITTPLIGGIAAALVLKIGLKGTDKSLPSGFLEAVVVGAGRLPFRASIARTFSSLVSISSGCSIGREGSIVNFSASVASKLGQLFDFQPYKLRFLTACGAAAGLSAAFNAPLSGAVFAAHIVIGNFSMSLFAPIILASVFAAMTSRSFFGIEPLYTVPTFEFTRIGQLPWLVLVGIGSGFIGAVFMKGMELSEKYFKKTIKTDLIRMAFGGLLVGVMAVYYPQVWGNGYGPANAILGERFTVQLLLGLFVAKILATIISVGSGAVGGVMTPSLFIGVAYGSFCGLGLHALGFGEQLPVCVFALSGMAGVFAATTHSPLLAMLMVFEISLNYSLMPALMLTCPLATLVSRQLHRNSVYTKPLYDKGITIKESKKPGTARIRTVADIMRQPVKPIDQSTPFQTIVERFLSSTNNFLPVVDSDNRLLGVVSLQDVKEYLNRNEKIDGIIAYDIMQPAHYLVAQQNLMEAFPVLIKSDIRNIPVVNDAREMKLIGSVLRSEALGIISEEIAAGG